MRQNGYTRLMEQFDRVDAKIAHWMARNGIAYVRVSLGIVFLWFGALKLVPGLSPAEELAGSTIQALTFGLVQPSVAMPILGVWECLIGIGLLSGRFLRTTLMLMALQMIGTVTPIVLFPGELFMRAPFVPTIVGQYVIKNVVLVSAAIVIGATVRGGKLRSEPTGEFARHVAA